MGVAMLWCATPSAFAGPTTARATATGSSASPPIPATSAGSAPVASPPSTPRRRALAVAASVVPGVLLHGAGSWAAGKPVAARRLLAAEMVGLGLIVIGGLPILATYGSPKVDGVGVPVTVAGVGVFVGSWLGDVWSSADVAEAPTRPRAELPRYLDAGVTWVRDPLRGNRGLLELGASWRRNALGVAPHGRLDALGRFGEGGLDLSWQLLGAPANGQLIEVGHRLVARLGAFARFDRDDRVSAFWHEAELAGRVDLRAVDGALAGTFLDVSAGVGFEVTRYSTAVYDVGSLLLARFAVGAYLGHGRGELAFSYDHRRDDLVGGSFAGRAAGFLGHVGAHLQLRLTTQTAVRVEAELGTALVTTVALRYGGS